MLKIILFCSCLLGILQAHAQIIDYALGFDQKAICSSDSIHIYTERSQIGIDYYLMDITNNVLQGPIEGTGNPLVFKIDSISSPISVTVKAISHGQSYEVNDYRVDADTNNRGIDQFVSIGTWIKTSDISPTTYEVIEKKYTNLFTSTGYSLDLSLGRASMSSFGNIANSSGTGTTYINGGQWHYVVGTIDLVNGIWNIYVDGALENSDTLSVPTGTLATSYPLTLNNDLNILFDEVTVWNRVISASEVQTFMNTCLSGNEFGIVAHFKFDEGLGHTFYDNSSMGINANSYGGANTWLPESNQICVDSLLFSDTITIVPSSSVPLLHILTPITTFLCPGDSTNITTDTSELGVDYFLIDTLSHATIDGPVQGTGSSISFETGAVPITTTYKTAIKKAHLNALAFDGVNDYLMLNFGNNFITPPVSATAWIKMNSSNSTQVVFHQESIKLYIDNQGKANVASTESGGGNHSVFATSTTSVDDNQWHYIVGVVEQEGSYGARLKIYVDGILESSNSIVYSVQYSIGNKAYIGCSISSIGEIDYFKGVISELAFFSKGLIDSEIQYYQNNCLEGNENALDLYYSFDQIAGNTFFDRSANSIYGQAHNMNMDSARVSSYSPCYNTCVQPISNPVTIEVEDMSLNYITTTGINLSTNFPNGTYQWVDCNNNNVSIAGATSQTYSPTVDGYYAVMTTSPNGCTNLSDCQYFSLNSIQKISPEFIEIYPNPSNNVLNIKTNERIEAIDVFSAGGILIKNITKSSFQQLPIKELPQGIYFLKIRTLKGILQYQFIKN